MTMKKQYNFGDDIPLREDKPRKTANKYTERPAYTASERKYNRIANALLILAIIMAIGLISAIGGALITLFGMWGMGVLIAAMLVGMTVIEVHYPAVNDGDIYA